MKSNGSLATCQIHDLLRDLCMSESKEDKGFEICTDNNILIPTKPRRLSIHSDMGHYISSSNNDHSCIRSLFFFGPEYDVRGREWKWLLEDFKLVRVLEFGPNNCRKIPSNLGNFINLRYLRICRMLVTFVPDSILNLWNLQTIEMGISIHNIPISFPIQIWKLKHLRHLNTQTPIKLRGKCSKSYKKMWNLQTISLLLVNKQSTSLIKQGTFPNIKRMGLFLDKNIGYEGELPNLLQNLQLLKHLNKLVIWPKLDCNLQEQVQSLGQFSCLTILMIEDVLDLLSSEVIFPPNITELMLSGIKCITDEGMNGLRNHSKLKILKLFGEISLGDRSMDSVNLNCVDDSFPQLEVLQMKHLRLRKWELGNGAMRRLQNVFIDNCEELDNLPTELCSLNGLRKIHIRGSLSEQMTDILQILETNNGVEVVTNNYPSWDFENDWIF